MAYKRGKFDACRMVYGSEAEYYLISRDGLLSVTFDLACVVDGEIVYITDEALNGEMKRYLESK